MGSEYVYNGKLFLRLYTDIQLSSKYITIWQNVV